MSIVRTISVIGILILFVILHDKYYSDFNSKYFFNKSRQTEIPKTNYTFLDSLKVLGGNNFNI